MSKVQVQPSQRPRPQLGKRTLGVAPFWEGQPLRLLGKTLSEPRERPRQGGDSPQEGPPKHPMAARTGWLSGASSWRHEGSTTLARRPLAPVSRGGVRLVHVHATDSTVGAIVNLKFLGIIPNTPTDESPTIWLDEETGDLLIQSYKATDEEVKACQEIGSIPGHSTDVPDHETITRLPAVMLKYIPRPDENGEAGSTATRA